MYIDYSKIFSYNALLNFIVASRGTGKTFGITDFVVDKFLKRKDELDIIANKIMNKHIEAFKELAKWLN